jgi:hypothetical protein
MKGARDVKVTKRILWTILIVTALALIGMAGFYVNQDVTLPTGVPQVGQP